jgi:MFS family permease
LYNAVSEAFVTTHPKQRRWSPRRQGLHLALYEAGLANVFTELTSGPRQIGFALLLGARDLQVGMLSALPQLANLSQLTASFLLEQTGKRKALTLVTAGLSRLVWLAIVLLPLSLFDRLSDLRIWVMVAIVALSALFIAMSNNAWLSWLGDLVPPRLRGRYFGRRNMVIAAVSMTVPLAAGALIDSWQSWFTPQAPGGFLIVFGLAIICGLVALAVQWRMPEMPLVPSQGAPFFSRLSIPLRDTNFRRFIGFHLCWGWSVNLAAPFFAVYMLKNLQLSYTFVTALASLTALSNLMGMRFWGQMTDRFSAKPVSLLGGLGAALLPGFWLTTAVLSPWVVLPLVHVLGGFAWSAFNLNVNTLLLALAPTRERSIYLSVYAALTGLTIAAAPIVGGLVGRMLQAGVMPLPSWLNAYFLLFALSCLLRLLSLLLFLRVHEPREVPLERLLPVFGNLRTLNTMMGFEPLFHHAYLQGERVDRFLVSRGNAVRQALAQLDEATDAYAAESEAHLRDWVDSGDAMFSALREEGETLSDELNDYVARSEASMARLLERLSPPILALWQRLRRWHRDDSG